MTHDVTVHSLEDERPADGDAVMHTARIDRMVRELRTFPQPEWIPWTFELLDRGGQAQQAAVWVALIAVGVVALSALALMA